MSVGKVVGNRDQYRIDALIARGAFSEVYRCRNVRTGDEYAIKVMSRKVAEENKMTQALIREINAMEIVGQCPFVACLVDKMVSKHNFYIVQGLAEGGTLLEFLRRRRQSHAPLSDKRIPFLFNQLLLGLATLHERNIAHRDIKPENLLLNGSKTRLMISDFGFACYAPEGRMHQRACGTLRYCAPELLCKSPSYDGRLVDVWAAGVTLYVMLFHVHPFQVVGSDADALLKCIASGPYRLPRAVPPEVEDLLSKMLSTDPKRRWTVPQLLEHPWMQSVNAAVLPEDLFVSTPVSALLATPTRRTVASLSATPLSPRGSHVAGSAAASSQYGGSSASPKATHDRTTLYDTIDDGFYRSSFHENHKSMDEREEFVSHAVPDCVQSIGMTTESERLSSTQASSYSLTSANSVAETEGLSGYTNMELQGRGLLLTLKVIFNFLFFCAALLFATVLRVLFDMDISDLPVPEKLRNLMQYLLIPPHEREEHKRASRGAAMQAQPHSLMFPHMQPIGPSSGDGGDATANMAGGPKPHVPGSRVRRYLRVAEQRIRNFNVMRSASRNRDGEVGAGDEDGAQRHGDGDGLMSPVVQLSTLNSWGTSLSTNTKESASTLRRRVSRRVGTPLKEELQPASSIGVVPTTCVGTVHSHRNASHLATKGTSGSPVRPLTALAEELKNSPATEAPQPSLGASFATADEDIKSPVTCDTTRIELLSGSFSPSVPILCKDHGKPEDFPADTLSS